LAALPVNYVVWFSNRRTMRRHSLPPVQPTLLTAQVRIFGEWHHGWRQQRRHLYLSTNQLL